MTARAWLLLAGCVAGTAALAEPFADSDESAARGEQIFNAHCLACHSGPDTEPFYPSMARVAALRSSAEMIVTVVEGRFHRGGEFDGQTIPIMPAWGRLSDAEVAAVVNFIKTHWGAPGDFVSAGDVAAARAEGPEIE